MGIKLPKKLIVAIIIALVVIVLMITFSSKISNITVPGIPTEQKVRFVRYATCALARCLPDGCDGIKPDKICLEEKHDIFGRTTCEKWCNETCEGLSGNICGETNAIEIELTEDVTFKVEHTTTGVAAVPLWKRGEELYKEIGEISEISYGTIPMSWGCIECWNEPLTYNKCANNKLGEGKCLMHLQCPVYTANCIPGKQCLNYVVITPFVINTTSPPHAPTGIYITREYADENCEYGVPLKDLNCNSYGDTLRKCTFKPGKYKFVPTYFFECWKWSDSYCESGGYCGYIILQNYTSP
jgi:hypothetical protein